MTANLVNARAGRRSTRRGARAEAHRALSFRGPGALLLRRHADRADGRGAGDRDRHGALAPGAGAELALACEPGAPPAHLLRGAIEHEYCERTLHGTFMEATPLLQHLGLGKSKVVPGFPQLMRPCKVCRQAVTFREGTPLVMVSQQKKALAVARASFGNLANAPG